MATSNEYAEYVLLQMIDIEEIRSRKMMGEYVLYYRDKVFGGIYDNRLLVKITQAGSDIIPDAKQEIPYEGAKPMLMVEEIEDRKLLGRLIREMYNELPMPKPKRKKSKEVL